MSKEEILLRAYENAKAAFIPVCDEECARVLREQCEKTAPERILEIGTAERAGRKRADTRVLRGRKGDSGTGDGREKVRLGVH